MSIPAWDSLSFKIPIFPLQKIQEAWVLVTEKKINFQPNYLKFLSDFVFHSQLLPWAERQVTLNFSPDATVLMTQTVTNTQGLCIKCAWLNFNLQKANECRHRSRTSADLFSERNKETQRYYKRCAFERIYGQEAYSASMRSWQRNSVYFSPLCHQEIRDPWWHNPLLQPRKWKWEEECHWLSLLQFPWNYHTDLSLVPSCSPSILHCASLSQACSKVLVLDSTFICSLLFVSRHTMAMYMVETWTSKRAFLPLSCKHRLDVSQIASLSWEFVALEVKSISQSGGLSHSSLLVSRHPQAICQ